MHESSLGNEQLSRLFLVCPTDNIEQVVRKNFEGEAFFYTALGVHFEFDRQTESDLWEIIVEKSIDQVVFVSSIENVFYEDAFGNARKRNYQIDAVLTKARMKISKPTSIAPNIHLLVAVHLASQKSRLLSTEYLGHQLTNRDIPVDICVYQPRTESFHSLGEIDEKGHLLDGISSN